MNRIDSLLRLLEQGQDSPMLRFGLGKAYLDEAQPSQAVIHLRQAVELQQDYSAAWKLLGKALATAGDTAAARTAYETGITIAQSRGDIQAVKEMRVFLKRLAPDEHPN